MGSKEIRIGVVGARRGLGFSAVVQHMQGVTMYALCDMELEKAESLKEKAGAKYVFDDFEQFIECGIDVAVIASPPEFHVQQAVDALRRNIHVLSEVPATHTINECFELLQAVRSSKAQYMLAENYRYATEVELVRRLVLDGRFGDLYYAEGAYIHDCRNIRRDANGHLTWRANYPSQIMYCTHSLAPVNYWWDNCRITTVIGQDTGPNRYEKYRTNDCDVALARNEDLGLIIVRADGNSPRPHQMNKFALQGTGGCYESGRVHGEQSNVYFSPGGKTNPEAAWEPLNNYAKDYLPDEWLNPPPEARAGGHGTSEWFMIRDFINAVRENLSPPIDIYAALNCTAPGLYAVASKLQAGLPVSVPDFRAVPPVQTLHVTGKASNEKAGGADRDHAPAVSS